MIAVCEVVEVLDQIAEPRDPGVFVAFAVGHVRAAHAEAHRRDDVVEPIGQILEHDALFVVRLVAAIVDQLELALPLEGGPLQGRLVPEGQLKRRNPAVAERAAAHPARAHLDVKALRRSRTLRHRQGRWIGIGLGFGGGD